MDQAIKTRGLSPLSPSVGAEVTGIDLSDMSDSDASFIVNAYHDHSALLFREQDLSDEDLISFSRLFGELDRAPQEQRHKAVPGKPEIYVVSNIRKDDGTPIGSLGAGEATWHADLTNRENPPDAIVLYALEIPPEGGDTWVAGMYAALDGMPAKLRQKIEGRSIKHDGTYNAGGYVRKGVEANDDPVTCPGTYHPAICQHPATGRPILYLGRRRNSYIQGLSLDESEALLDELWAHATGSEYCYVHKWRRRDLLMWDNRSTLHRRDQFDPSHRRKMHRTVVNGQGVPCAT